MSFAFSAINTAFRFSEFVIHLKEVGAENAVFVRTIERIRHDLIETERLLQIPAVKAMLSNSPDRVLWIDRVLFSTKTALNDIGLYVERARSDSDRDGNISFSHRVRWVLDDHGKLDNRRSELAACHQSLATVIATLHPIEMLASHTIASPVHQDTTPPQYAEIDFKSPYARKRIRKKAAQTVEIVDLKSKQEEYNTAGGPSQITQQNLLEAKSDTIQLDICTLSEKNQHPVLSHKVAQQYLPNNSPISPKSEQKIPPRDSENYCTSSNYLGPVNSWDMWNEACMAELPAETSSLSPVDISPLDNGADNEASNKKIVDSNNTTSMQGDESKTTMPPKVVAENQDDPVSLRVELSLLSIGSPCQGLGSMVDAKACDSTSITYCELEAGLWQTDVNSNKKEFSPAAEFKQLPEDFGSTESTKVFELLADIPTELCGAEVIHPVSYDPRKDWVASYMSSQKRKIQQNGGKDRNHFGEIPHRQSLPSKIASGPFQPQAITAYHPDHYHRRSLPTNNFTHTQPLPHNIPMPPYPESPRLRPISPLQQMPHPLSHRGSDISMMSSVSRELSFSPISMPSENPSSWPTPAPYPDHQSDTDLTPIMWNTTTAPQRTPTNVTEKRRRRRAAMSAAFTSFD